MSNNDKPHCEAYEAMPRDAQFSGVVAAANYAMDGRRSNSPFDHADCFGVGKCA